MRLQQTIFTLFALVLCGTLAGADPRPEDILKSQELFKEGVLLERAKKLEAARDQFRAAVDKDYNNVKAHLHYQQTAIKLNDPHFEDFYAKSLQDRKGDPIFNYVAGNALALLGKHRSAKKRFETALDLDPKCYFAHGGLGKLAAANNEFDSALDHYSKALSINPHYYEGLLDRAVLYLTRAGALSRETPGKATEMVEKALTDLNIAVAIDANEPVGFQYRAMAYNALGKNDEGIKDLTTIINLNPKDADTWLRRAEYMMQLGKIKDAVEDFNEAIKVDSTNIAAYCSRGAVYQAVGDMEKALGDFELAVRIDPSDPRGYQARGLAYAETGKIEFAIKDFDQAVALSKPANPVCYMSRAAALAAAAKLDDAVRDYDKVVELCQPNTALYLNALVARAMVFHKQEKFEKAVADYTRVMELDKHNSTAMAQLETTLSAMKEKGIDVEKEQEKISKRRVEVIVQEMKIRPKDDRTQYGIQLCRQMATMTDVKSEELDILGVLARDPETSVRVHVIRAMGNTGKTACASLIRPALADNHCLVRGAAVEALGKTLGRKATPDMIPLLNDPELYVREEVERLLTLVTGQLLGSAPQPWKDWWDKNKTE